MRLPGLISIGTAFERAGGELARWLRALGSRTGPGGFAVEIARDERLGEGYVIEAGEEGLSIRAGGPGAAVYAVHAFLEQMLGCRVLAEDCSLLPEGQPELTPGRLEGRPAFAYRELYWRGALQPDFALRLRLNASRGGLPEGLASGPRFYNYSHSFEKLVDPDVWFDSHPEYFSLVGGRRRKDRSQLCLSNPEVLALVTEGVRAWMRDNPGCNVFSVSMNDWYAPCECADCASVDAREGSQAGSLLRFVNQVADGIREEFPHNFIHTFAYLYGRKPPSRLRARDNVIIRLCPIERCFSHGIDECSAEVGLIDVETASARAFREGGSFRRDLKGWAAACSHLYIWDYTTNYANYLQPFPCLRALQRSLKWYRDNGVEGVFLQGNYSPGQASAFAALKVYVTARLLWDPDADLDRLTEQFVRGYYGQQAAPLVLSCLALAEEAVRPCHMSLYDGPDAPYLAGGWLERCQALLERAILLTPDPLRRERLERELLSPRYALLAALPLDHPGRAAELAAFEKDCRRLGISELFERRELAASFQCLRESRYARDRSRVPYAFYRL